MREKLTAGRIDGFKCTDKGKPAFLWDTEAKGLGVKASPGGAKQFVLEARLNDKTLRLTIGDTRTWALDGPAGKTGTARAEARRLMALIDQGIDPRQQKAEQRATAEAKKSETERRDILLLDVWRVYIEARKPRWSARHLSDHESLAHAGGRKSTNGKGITSPGPLAALMPLKLGQIDAECVKAWLRDEAARRPTQASLAYRLLCAFLRWCEDTPAYRGIASPNACSTRIAKDILPKRGAKHDCLQKEQLKAWFGSVRAINNPHIAAYLQILVLIGARPESLVALNWENVDFRWQSLTIRDKDESKGGVDGTRTIPLTPYVASLLSDLKRRNDTPPPKHRILHGKRIENDLENWKPSPWVFASKTSALGYLNNPNTRHTKACAIAGIEDLTLQGLRRTFKTQSEWCEVPAGVTAQIMGHKASAIAEKHYTVRPLDMLRMWHVKIEAWFLEQAGIEFKQEQAGLKAVPAVA